MLKKAFLLSAATLLGAGTLGTSWDGVHANDVGWD